MATKTKTRPVGRPSKYASKMLPVIIKEMSEGASLVEVAAEIGVDMATITDWRDTKSPRYNEEFSITIKRGVELSQAWWHKMGRTNLKDKDFRDALWYMNMKNRFGWRDKHEEIDKPPANPITFINTVPNQQVPSVNKDA